MDDEKVSGSQILDDRRKPRARRRGPRRRGVRNFQKYAQLLQPSIVMVPDVRQGVAQTLGDLTQQESLITHELDRLPLLRLEEQHSLVDGRGPIVGIQAVAVMGWNGGFDNPLPHAAMFIEAASGQIFSPVEAAVIGILQQPGAELSALRIEFGGVSIDFEKDILHDVFRLGPISYDAGRSLEYQTIVTFE